MAEVQLLQDDDVRVEHIAPEKLRARLEQLFAQGFLMLTDIGGVDYPEREQRFDIVYMLTKIAMAPATLAAIGSPERVRLVCAVGGNPATLPTVSDIWPSANWPEREIYDLFGVHFSGHPDLRRIQMPNDWVGHPLRKDYPLRGPAREAAPRPNFALKSNVPSGTPAAGKVAAAIAARKAAALAAEGTER